MSDAIMPNGTDELRAGSNGDWIVTVGLEGKWNLVNVYTRRKINLPALKEVEATDSVLTFMDLGRPGSIVLQKISLCKVPTAAGRYDDFSLVALFDFSIAVLHGSLSTWTMLKNNFHCGLSYSDGIIHHGLVFAVNVAGVVYAWDRDFPAHPSRLTYVPPEVHYFLGYPYGDGDDEDVDEADRVGRWWLAKSPNSYRLLLVFTRGPVTAKNGGIHHAHAVAGDTVVHRGRTLRTYVW